MEKIATRVAYGNALKEFGGDARVIALEADLGKSTMSATFGAAYPERYLDMGIAEANMIGVAAGLATCGKIPFTHSFAIFTPGRVYDQIRNSVAYPGLNVKIVGSHAGVTVGQDGATHQALEDIALMRALPGMTVLSPADANETRLAVKAMIDHTGPCYMRTGRLAVPQITNDIPSYKFELGKGVTLAEGGDLAILTHGYMVAASLAAREMLAKRGISARVINLHTIKPLDEEIVLKAAKETRAVVIAEEHNIIGGLGSAVAELLSEKYPTYIERVGVKDEFGKSGDPEALAGHFGLTAGDISAAAERLIAKNRCCIRLP
ncbi:MAG: transketolase family protein [Oscillospiraceae bacterium]|nr:transketolase family protein [Oscillospiraceae bacterium]